MLGLVKRFRWCPDGAHPGHGGDGLFRFSVSRSYAIAMPSALFVVSEEGYWGEECIEPLTTLTDAGVDIEVATPSGSPPVIDERSVDPDEVGEETAEHCLSVHENDERLNDPTPIAQVDAAAYDAVVFPGGHGTEWDITQDSDARRLLRDAVEGEEGKAMVVCHAVGILAFTRDSDGGFLVEGRSVTGFPNAWEEGIVDENDLMPDGRKLPYWVEDEVEAVGGNWDAELDEDTSVTVDGDLVTARGPPSSAEAARTLLAELGAETPA
jgi:putative intracellular protease/amidase